MEAKITFPDIKMAEEFAIKYSRMSGKGHTIGPGVINVDVSVYGLTEEVINWINDYVNNINN